MTVVAVDDEEISLMCLEAVLDSMDDVDKVLTFSNAEDTIDYFKTGKADAAFLDIQLYLSGGSLPRDQQPWFLKLVIPQP